jgi:hypothetical protein
LTGWDIVIGFRPILSACSFACSTLHFTGNVSRSFSQSLSVHGLKTSNALWN